MRVTKWKADIGGKWDNEKLRQSRSVEGILQQWPGTYESMYHYGLLEGPSKRTFNLENIIQGSDGNQGAFLEVFMLAFQIS